MIDRRQFVTAAGAAASATALATRTRAQARGKVILQIDGAAVPYYAPIYVALDKGFFARRGVDLEIIYAAASDILVNIAAGNVTLGFPNGDAVVAARSNGLPVKVVHTTYQRGIGALIALEKTNIRGYRDLKGKNVAVTSLGSPNYLQLQVGLQAAGVPLEAVDVEVISTGAIVQALQGGTVDAIVFSELRKYTLEAAGVPVTSVSSNDVLPSFGNVLVTGEATLAKRPGTIRAVIDGLDEGLRYVIDGHADEAIALSIAKYAPTFAGQEAVIARAFADAFISSIWQSPLTRAKGLGAGDLAGWQRNIDILARYKVIPERFEAADLVVQPADIKG